MRFYEYESRRIVEQAGIPVTKYGFVTTAEEAKATAAEIGGPGVSKSHVVSGGGVKGGGGPGAGAPDADPLEPRPAVLRARHDTGRDQPARPARGRPLRRPRRAHGDGERGA